MPILLRLCRVEVIQCSRSIACSCIESDPSAPAAIPTVVTAACCCCVRLPVVPYLHCACMVPLRALNSSLHRRQIRAEVGSLTGVFLGVLLLVR
jgi:hypothetical protein